MRWSRTSPTALPGSEADWDSNVTVVDSTVVGNMAVSYGGGFTSFAERLRIEGSTITDNVAESGAGVYANGPRVEIVGSTLLRNYATFLGGGAQVAVGELVSEGSDWGTDADDNLPDDLLISMLQVVVGYGADETFTCTPESCTPEP